MRPLFWMPALGVGFVVFFIAVWIYEPSQILNLGVDDDSEGAVNTEALQRLSPEEWSFAADIDDLDVLLNEIDSHSNSSSIPSALDSQNQDTAQTASKTGLTDTPSDSEAPAPVLSLLNPSSLLIGSPSSSQTGFLGLNAFSPTNDTRSLESATGSRTLTNTNNTTSSQASASQNFSGSLEQALARFESQNSSQPQHLFGTSQNAFPSPALYNEANIAETTSSRASSDRSASTQSTPINPFSSSSVANPANPVPLSPATPSSLVPITPASAPLTPSPVLFQAPNSLSPQNSLPSLQSIQPGLPIVPQAQQLLPSAAPLPQTGLAAPFSIPNQPPGQYIGNGQINTFSNP